MPELLLVTEEEGLHRELLQALEGSEWSCAWAGAQSVPPSSATHDVVVLDAKHPYAKGWQPAAAIPVLLIAETANIPDPLPEYAADWALRPLRGPELRLRLSRLHARPALNHSSHRYADMFASAALAMVVVSANRDIVFANPRAYELVGHREGTLARNELRRVIAPEDIPLVQEILAGFSEGTYPRGVDLRLVRRDGTKITCNCSFAPLIGAEENVVISFEDVTEQRETEEELIKTMEFLESLIDASVDAIVATDIEQRILLFNPSAERISGRHVADVVGKLGLADFLGVASAELVMERLLSDEHGGRGRLEPMLIHLLDIHGVQIPVQLSASLIYEADEPSAIVLIFADLRDKLRVERRLAEAQKKLAFTEDQTVLAELAGTAAHELNQPLTSLMAYAELLHRKSEPGSLGSNAAEVLLREAERMADIVRKIGRITHYETTSYVGQQNIFDLDKASDAPEREPAEKG